MSPHPDNELRIGVDGGATEVKAHEILVLSLEAAGGRPRLGLGPASASCCYDRAPGFEPVALERQLAEAQRGEIDLGPEERATGELWLDAIAGSVLAIVVQAGVRVVRVGVCLPGLKTADRRGTVVVRHGPRIPDFLDRLEARLADEGLELACPIPPLLGDGDACGLGEEADAHGLFRDVADAYYIGGGTGVAECFKLAGRVTGLDALGAACPKAWELVSPSGVSYDDAVSVGGINRAYAERSGAPLPIEPSEFPEQRALRGDPLAIEVVTAAAHALAELVLQRILLVQAGSARSASGSRAIAAGTTLERVVLGQRLGRLYGEPSLRRVFRRAVDEALARSIEARGDPASSARYLDGAVLRAGWLVASTLRAAPAIGAAAHALDPSRSTRHPLAPSVQAGAPTAQKSVLASAPARRPAPTRPDGARTERG